MGLMGRSKKLSDVQVLEEVVKRPDPVVTPKELAGVTSYGIDGIRGRLEDLESKGWLKSRKVGSRARIWWVTDQGREQLR